MADVTYPILGGGGYLNPPSQVLLAVLPTWSFQRGGVPEPSFPGPYGSPFHLVVPAGGREGVPCPCDLSHNAFDVTCLLSSHPLASLTRGGYLGQLNQSCLKLNGIDRSSLRKFPCLVTRGDPSPELDRLTDRQTCLKTLPSRTLCKRAVKRLFVIHIHELVKPNTERLGFHGNQCYPFTCRCKCSHRCKWRRSV